MRIVSWNCNGKFRKKYEFIKNLEADIYVIQECENSKVAEDAEYRRFASNSLWVGEKNSKGLGVFAKSNIDLRNNQWNSASLQYFLSVRVNEEFDLLGVWAMPPYIQMHWNYHKINKEKYNKDMVIIGDFNSNTIWDKKNDERSHSKLNENLVHMGLQSAHHFSRNEKQGKESVATFYLQRKLEKPYHIDYCYLSKEKLLRFTVGEPIEWLQYSDHMPLIVEIAHT